MPQQAEWRNQGLVGIDGWCRTLAFPALSAETMTGLFEDFPDRRILTTTTMQGWTVSEITAVDAGTLTSGTTIGGWLNLVGTTNDGAGIQAQHCSVSWLPAANKHIWFECRIQVTDADDMDWLVGLSSTDTNVFDTAPTTLIVFRGDDGDANIDFQVRDADTGSAADTTVDLADGTAIRLGFYVNGATSVTPYINGTAYTAVTTNIPTAAMQLTLAAAGGATDSNTLAVDWYRILQLR